MVEMETELQLMDSAASPRMAKLKSPSSSVGSIHEYTSPKDILLGLDSPTATLGGAGGCSRGSRSGSGINVVGHGGFDSSAICIRNQLERVRAFIRDDGGKDVLVLHVQDPFRRLLLHGVCEFYNLVSITVTTPRDTKKLWKTTRIKKKAGSPEMPPNIRLVRFLKMAKEGEGAL